MAEKIKPIPNNLSRREFFNSVVSNSVKIIAAGGATKIISTILGCAEDNNNPVTSQTNNPSRSKSTPQSQETQPNPKPDEKSAENPDPKPIEEIAEQKESWLILDPKEENVLFIKGNFIPTIEPQQKRTGVGNKVCYNINLAENNAIAIIVGWNISWGDKFSRGEKGGFVVLEDGSYEVIVEDGEVSLFPLPKNLTHQQHENIKIRLAEEITVAQLHTHGFPLRTKVVQWDSPLKTTITRLSEKPLD